MNVGSLFSGIGGLDLGLERAGMTVIWQSEIDPYASRVLAKHWPTVPNLGDITTIDWSQVEPVDLICGGYPCQPFSLAGVRRGESDPRHLWPYMLRAVRRVRPRFALLENVPGHLSMGFGRVLGDLAESGYLIEWDCIPAAAVGAPHRRDRIFAVAYRHGGRLQERGEPHRGQVFDELDTSLRHDAGRLRADVADTALESRIDVPGKQRDTGEAASDPRRVSLLQPGRCGDQMADPDHTRQGQRCPESSGRSESERLAGWWSVEPDVGRVAHGVPNRVDRLRCLGNAVVPQVAEWIGHRIMEAAA